jgi:hypothetical protein
MLSNQVNGERPMKMIILGAGLILVAAPALAQRGGAAATPRGPAPVARPMVVTPRAPVVVARPVAGPVVVTPRRPVDPRPTDRQQLAAALAAAEARAANAVANGASPERVRSKLQDYKQKLIRRYNASH